jgi:hypothetical protein
VAHFCTGGVTFARFGLDAWDSVNPGKEEEEPYLKFGDALFLLISFYSVYPTYRSCFKEFWPLFFFRIGIVDTK